MLNLEKIEEMVTDKSEKIMTNQKVEGLINNVGGLLCFVGAVVFGVLFLVCSGSLIKTGKHYVVKPSAEKKAEEAQPEAAPTAEAAAPAPIGE